MNGHDMGSYKKSVFEIQTFLNNLSRVDTDIPRVNPDGIYGSTTENAVLAFQKKYGLTQSGLVDFITWRSMLKRSKEALELTNEPISISPFSTYIEGGELIIGDSGEIVFLVKMMLRTAGSSYPLGEELSEGMIFDEATEEAVMDFQVINGLAPTGRVDKITWNRLSMAYNKYLNTI